MSKTRWMFTRVCWTTCAAVGMVALATPSAWAILVNKYTFNNGNANDSIGGQHGNIVDNTGLAQFVGGAIDLSGNSPATGSNQNFSLPTTAGAYVNLPNQIFTNAVKGGTYGAVTLEIWFKVSQNHTWAEVFSFGRSRDGEDTSVNGDNSDYIALVPRSGPGDFRALTRSSGNAEAQSILTPGAAPLNTTQHVVFVMDQTDTNGGANLNGTASVYLNNGAPVKAALQPFIDIMGGDFDTGGDYNNWLGRSQWPDTLFDGSIDEFRIYDHALTAGEVTTSFTTGPDAAPLPKLIVNRDTGAIQLANASGSGIVLKGYSVTSAAGALNSATWTSIDADNVFDPNGAWTAQSATSLNLTESVTGQTLDGGTLNASSQRGIGTPWFRTPIEDLVFGFTLGNNTTAFGTVEYIGNDGVPIGRSDFNGDGTVNAADWAMFAPNAYTNISAETRVGAFRKGDTDGDFDNDLRDYQNFKRDFMALNGAAAFAALAGAVPEPGSFALAAMAGGLVLGSRRQRSKASCRAAR
jgi:hypothetical protein